MRDQREVMERPFFSLAKSKRTKPIDYTSPDGKIWVHVSANPEYGMATIWDADILIYCASVVSDMKRRGTNDVPQTLNIMPYDLLRVIGRPDDRGGPMSCWPNRSIVSSPPPSKPTSGPESRREATFSWLDSWTQLVEERTERSKGMSLTLARWFWEGLTMDGGVLSIDPAYFDLTGGPGTLALSGCAQARWGGRRGRFRDFPADLFDKSGAEGVYRRFKFEIAAIVRRNALPGFHLALEERGDKREPHLRMTSRHANENGGTPAKGLGSAKRRSEERAGGPDHGNAGNRPPRLSGLGLSGSARPVSCLAAR